MREDYMKLTAPVFNVQTYSIHDGPGIRVTVFLKGCPLRCIWCANPESNLATPQLMTYGTKCTGCGRCLSKCPKNAISIGPDKNGKMIALTDRARCVVSAPSGFRNRKDNRRRSSLPLGSYQTGLSAAK